MILCQIAYYNVKIYNNQLQCGEYAPVYSANFVHAAQKSTSILKDGSRKTRDEYIMDDEFLLQQDPESRHIFVQV